MTASTKTPSAVKRLAPTGEFQGQIRPSQVNQLLDKRKKQGYGQYLNKVILTKVRGFSGQEVSFDFPVTAIIGPNGGGKTTILGAAACAYSVIKPRQFFSKSGPFDSSMKEWTIEYEILDRKENPKGILRRTASFRSSKWSREALSRDVLVFGVSRTVPATERPDMRRCTTGKFKVGADQVSRLEPEVALAVQRILGKDVENYSHIKIDGRGKISLLSAHTPNGVKYSEFHFGAGESSIIRMIRHIEHAKDHCLILIEEIENGLHPVATVRMVEYLVDVAQRKNAQAIFTTHSNDALKPLPDEAVWASVDQTVFQGKLDVHALRAITGQVDSQLVVFVEDAFAKQWVESVLRLVDPDSLGLVEVHGMHGDGMAVAVNRHHNLDPSHTADSICMIDGDSRQEESAQNGVFRLPGASPEAYIYDSVLENLDRDVGLLAVALHQRFEDQPHVSDVVQDVRRVNRDAHILFSQVARKLGFLSEEVVRSAFLSVWTQRHQEIASKIAVPILARLPQK
ncbi:MAG: AAA family ATPase [Myxococcales bacterium]|nr:AAA family ATPase [Myxococcales bacterium]